MYWLDHVAVVTPPPPPPPNRLAQNAQDGSVCIRDTLASFLDSGRMLRPVICLYINFMW